MSFQKVVALEDGTQLQLRAIQPYDKAALADGFARLSHASRRSRFNAAKTALSDSELRFFTECDGLNHYAIVAIHHDQTTGQSMGVGVARFVRTDDNPAVAELGITVLDEWQRRGVGGVLSKHIIAAAAERRIERVRAVMLADNKKMKGLISHNQKDPVFRHENGLLVFDYPIASKGAVQLILLALRQLTFGTMIIPLRVGEQTLRQFLPPVETHKLSSDYSRNESRSGEIK